VQDEAISNQIPEGLTTNSEAFLKAGTLISSIEFPAFAGNRVLSGATCYNSREKEQGKRPAWWAVIWGDANG
jgi:hypothetical protein